MGRLAVGIEYDGSAYHGWQSQTHAPSIQTRLNEALSSVADEAVNCVGAGRTDAGVHALAQVAHFDTHAQRSTRSWVLGANANLPDDINLLWAHEVAPDFHARYTALSRAYRYRILNRSVRSALERERAWWVHQPLDEARMQAAAEHLVGEHDFSSFRAAACQSRTAVRQLREITVRRQDGWITISCRANAFLHHMVRNIVGTLVKVGTGEAAPDWTRELLEQRDRRLAGMTAPAEGLYLVDVEYPQECGLGVG